MGINNQATAQSGRVTKRLDGANSKDNRKNNDYLDTNRSVVANSNTLT